MALFYAKEIKAAPDTEAFRARKIQEYSAHYSDTLSLASDVTYIQDIIEPRETRCTLIRSFRLIQTKKKGKYLKRHGNMPL